MIRKYTKKDIDTIMEIWLNTNLEVHDFIEKDHWLQHYADVKSQITQAEIFVYEKNGNILGFLGLQQNYIAGIFVKKQARSKGIGKQLLDYAKNIRMKLFLHVYEKNNRAIQFYKKAGFHIKATECDMSLNEIEFTMEWKKDIIYSIRKMEPCEYDLLEDFLYEAIFQNNVDRIPKSIIQKPELQVYIKDFGNVKDDDCLCCIVNHKIIGAVWVRDIKGYGTIDGGLELAIALYERFRGYGLGTQLMKRMLQDLKAFGYEKVSLSVHKDNSAYQMYVNLGFKVFLEKDKEVMMIYHFE